MNYASNEHYMEDMAHRIEHIKEMEKIYDRVQEWWNTQSLDLENPEHRNTLSQLILYLKSPAWINDYTADENGEFPKDLKRGVLSQDGLYNLLSDILTEEGSSWFNEETSYDI